MIYEPREDSFLLAEEVKKYAAGKVLDMGTGSGVQARIAAKLKKVKFVIAADINKEAIVELKKQRLSKIKAIQSDLFSNVKEKFDTVIFNPPYLPYDKREAKESQLTTTGGKHGYEILIKFISDLNEHLTKEGIALILFSSLTNKSKIDEALEKYGFEHEQLIESKLDFESLFIYKIKRNWILDKLFEKKITNVKPLMKGHRGAIYTGFLKDKKVAIKAQRLDINVRTVERESGMIAKVNKKGIAPKLISKGVNYFVYDFAEGEFIIDFLEHSKKAETIKVLKETLRQCRILDRMHITKQEMHNPFKHVIVGKRVVLVDFERAHYDRYPKNVSQFCQYIMRNISILKQKRIILNQDKIIELSKIYKNNQTESNFKKINNLL